MTKRLVLAMLCAYVCLTTSCTRKETSRTEYVMGTVCTIRVFERITPEAFDNLFKRLAEIENALSANKEGTDIARINNAAGISAVIARQETITVLTEALRFGELTNGLLDPSVGPLVKAWNIGTDMATIPSDKELTAARELVDYRKVSVNRETGAVFLKTKGMKLDLGAIAKGYAADELATMLTQNGIRRAIIDLGGNIYALGDKAPGTPWTIGIKNPENAAGAPIISIKVANKSIVTSGVYERYFEENGKRYHHILNPKTGYPADNKLVSVSIVADTSIDADALSTSAFLLGEQRGMALIDSIAGAEGIFIDASNTIRTTAGLRGNITILDAKFRLED